MSVRALLYQPVTMPFSFPNTGGAEVSRRTLEACACRLLTLSPMTGFRPDRSESRFPYSIHKNSAPLEGGAITQFIKAVSPFQAWEVWRFPATPLRLTPAV